MAVPAWEEVAVAATERTPPRRLGSIVAAALSLPGLVASPAMAETAPEKGSIALKYLYYKDFQKVEANYPGETRPAQEKFERIRVKSPSVQVVVPIGSEWSVEAGATVDEVSGATPTYYSSVSGATKSPCGMSDYRKAGDVKVTRHFHRAAVAVGLGSSSEHDFESNALAVEGRLASEDNNTTWHAGVGATRDRIGSSDDPTLDERRRTNEGMVGVTRVLTANDVVQVNVGYRHGRGYFSDPYKAFDRRPDTRRQGTVLTRWNHHVASLGSTVRSSYRFYKDSFGISAHTVEAAWVQPFGDLWSLTPSVRYYTQSAARFYCDPSPDVLVFPGCAGSPAYSTVDQRMSAFGALTLGIKLLVRWDDWTGDVKYERYTQKSGLRAGGGGSPGLDPLFADIVQLGVSKSF